jgi:hypothetical protein
MLFERSICAVNEPELKSVSIAPIPITQSHPSTNSRTGSFISLPPYMPM